jgi:hypothetical protein
MITAKLRVTEGPVSRDLRVRAASLGRAMLLAGGGKHSVSVEVIGPLAPIHLAATQARRATIPARAA